MSNYFNFESFKLFLLLFYFILFFCQKRITIYIYAEYVSIFCNIEVSQTLFSAPLNALYIGVEFVIFAISQSSRGYSSRGGLVAVVCATPETLALDE